MRAQVEARGLSDSVIVEDPSRSSKPGDGGYLGPSPYLKNLQADRLLTKDPRLRSVENYAPILIGLPSTLLARPGSRIDREF